MSKQTQRYHSRYADRTSNSRKERYQGHNTSGSSTIQNIAHTFLSSSPNNTATKRMATTVTSKFSKKARLIRSQSISQDKPPVEKSTPRVTPSRTRRASPPASCKNGPISSAPKPYMLKASHQKNSLSSPPVIFLDIAPHLGSTKTPTAFQSKINGSLNNSRCSVLGPNTETPKYTSYSLAEAIELEMQLSDRIRELKAETNKNLAAERYEVFKLFFSKVIEKDSTYSSILRRIKREYDEMIISNSVNTTVNVIDKYIDEISEIKNQYSQERKEKLSYKIRYEKLLQENQELSIKLSESEKKLNKLENQLACLKSIKIDHLPKDELTWQYILSENQSYCDLFSKLEKRLKSEFRREKKLVDLICALKERGYPVEEVYHDELKKKRKPRKSFDEVNITSEDEQCDTETEPIAIGPPKVLLRPSQVPPLNLKRLNNESSEEETPLKCDSISESTKSFKMTVDTHAEGDSSYKKLYSSESIPKLQIPTEWDSNFHSEFMSKMNEFSSSWKSLIEKENR